MDTTHKNTRSLRCWILSMVSLLALAGCYDGPVSKNPISAPAANNIDHDLLGTWGLIVDDKQYAVVHFEIDDKKKGTIKAYLFNYRNTSDSNSDVFFGHFSRIGKSRYLNLYETPVSKSGYATQPGKEKDKTRVPYYLFIKYEIRGKTLTMAHMNSYFVSASIKHAEIKGSVYGKGGGRITDESSTIEEYIRKHENDIFSSRLEFGGKFSLSRVKYQAREVAFLKQLKNWPVTKVKQEPDYDKVIELYPDDADVYYQRGMMYKYKSDHDMAIRDFSKVIELSPNNANAYHDRGEAYTAKGEHDLAIRDFDKAIERNPTNAWNYKSRADAYKAKNDFDRATSDYSKAIELSGMISDSALIGRGEAYYAEGDFDSAIQDYSEVLRAYSDNYPDVFIKRGDAYRSKGDFKMAAQDYINHGDALIKKKNFDGAIMDYTRAAELAPQDAASYKKRGNAYKFKGDYDNAVRDYGKAIELNPKDEYTYLALINASMKISQHAYKDSMGKLRIFVNDNPSDEWVRTISKFYLGVDGLSERDFLKEAKKGTTAEEINARLCGAYYYLGEERWFKGDRQGATELFIESIDNVRKCIEADSAEANLTLMEIQK